MPDTGERLVRKGFIALGAVEEYSAGVVHRHEQTLAGPKKDRLELLRHTHAHFGQLFMLYPDPAGAIDALLDEAARSAPLAEVTDEYGAMHRIWKIADARARAAIDGGQEAADRRRPPPLRDGAGVPQARIRAARRGPRDDDVRQHAFAGAEDSGDTPAGERHSRHGRLSGRVPARRRPPIRFQVGETIAASCGRWNESADRSIIGAAIGTGCSR